MPVDYSGGYVQKADLSIVATSEVISVDEVHWAMDGEKRTGPTNFLDCLKPEPLFICWLRNNSLHRERHISSYPFEGWVSAQANYSIFYTEQGSFLSTMHVSFFRQGHICFGGSYRSPASRTIFKNYTGVSRNPRIRTAGEGGLQSLLFLLSLTVMSWLHFCGDPRVSCNDGTAGRLRSAPG